MLLLAQTARSDPNIAFSDAGGERITFGGSGGPLKITARLDSAFAAKLITNHFLAKDVSVSFVASTGGTGRMPATVMMSVYDEGGGEDIELAAFPANVSKGRISLDLTPLRERLSGVFVLRAERHVHLPHLNAIGGNVLSPDGANVLQVLNSLSSSEPDLYRQIVRHATSLVPGIENISAPIREDRADVFGQVRERASGLPAFDWQEVASGTRHLLALLILLLASPAGSLLLLEEPESFLHPQATVDLFKLLEEKAEEQQKQIILTTHSPVLMELAGSRLSVVVRDDATGVSDIVRLSRAGQKALTERGIMKSFMLAPFEPGLIPAGILIVEGADDVAVWSQWLGSADLAKKGVFAVKGGDGEGDAIKLAVYMQHLQDSGIRSGPFLLVLDSDDKKEDKRQHVLAQGLRDENFYVLERKELEDYLLDAAAISGEFQVEEAFVASEIEKARPGKEGLNSVVAAVSEQKGMPKSESVDSTMKGRIASRVACPDELQPVLGHFSQALAKK